LTNLCWCRGARGLRLDGRSCHRATSRPYEIA
jgi:hypothetical protein